MVLTDEFLNQLYEKALPVVERKCQNANVAMRNDKENIIRAVKFMYQHHIGEGLDPDKTPNIEAFITALMVQTWFSMCNT